MTSRREARSEGPASLAESQAEPRHEGEEEALTQLSGTVKWFDATRGFGFIVSDGDAGDVLIHFSVLRDHGRRTLPEGARVLFYTDGLIETRNRQGAFFPLVDIAATLRTGSLDDALDGLLEKLDEHAADQIDDDMALVLAERRTTRAGVG